MALDGSVIPVSRVFSCPDPDLHDKVRAVGAASNRRSIYTIEFTHRKLYRLLNILEDRAVKADHYSEVEDLCEMVRYIRQQAEEEDKSKE